MVSKPPMPFQLVNDSTTEASAGSQTSPITKRVGTATIAMTTSAVPRPGAAVSRRLRRWGACGLDVRVRWLAGGPATMAVTALAGSVVDDGSAQPKIDYLLLLDALGERRRCRRGS